jgi:hypothetical protein
VPAAVVTRRDSSRMNVARPGAVSEIYEKADHILSPAESALPPVDFISSIFDGRTLSAALRRFCHAKL